MTGRATGAACAGLTLGAGVLGVVVALFQRTLRPTLEIARYSNDIRAAGDGISRHLEGAAELRHTSALAAAAPDLAGALLRQLDAR